MYKFMACYMSWDRLAAHVVMGSHHLVVVIFHCSNTFQIHRSLVPA